MLRIYTVGVSFLELCTPSLCTIVHIFSYQSTMTHMSFAEHLHVECCTNYVFSLLLFIRINKHPREKYGCSFGGVDLGLPFIEVIM